MSCDVDALGTYAEHRGVFRRSSGGDVPIFRTSPAITAFFEGDVLVFRTSPAPGSRQKGEEKHERLACGSIRDQPRCTNRIKKMLPL